MTRTGLRGSLRFYPKFLDDRPPFLGIGLHQRPEHLWCLSLTRESLITEFGEPRLYRRIGKGRDRRRIELGDDIFWRALGREKPVPRRPRNLGKSQFGKGGNIRCRGQTRVACRS